MPFYAQHIKAGRLHLQKHDPVMKRILKSVGPFQAKTRRDRFGTLVDSIISQQISVAAAKTIRGRLLAVAGDGKRNPGMTPEALLEFDVDALRAVGLSRQKATYVLDLADKVTSRTVALDELHRQDDESVIESLTQVKGIGIWTAQIFLMFSLGRLDVFPMDDLGIKNAIRDQYKLDAVPEKNEMEAMASNWRPYATIACWYLWQSLELE
jgi:DNA-3-methyladenine glycosylase II